MYQYTKEQKNFIKRWGYVITPISDDDFLEAEGILASEEVDIIKKAWAEMAYHAYQVGLNEHNEEFASSQIGKKELQAVNSTGKKAFAFRLLVSYMKMRSEKVKK